MDEDTDKSWQLGERVIMKWICLFCKKRNVTTENFATPQKFAVSLWPKGTVTVDTIRLN